MPSVPYTIEHPTQTHAVIRVAQICDHTRTSDHEKELLALLEANTHVACDLSASWAVTASWFRWFGTLALQTQQSGKVFVLVNASEGLIETIEVLNLKKTFYYAQKVEDVWSL